MKKCKKLLAFTLSVLLAFACYVVPAFASSSANQYGLEATLVTDKESYKANEEIHVTVTVKNTNAFKVEAVSIESLLPETLTLKDGSNSTKTVDLEPGETLTLSFTAVKEKEETSATKPESQSTEPTETETVIPSESETVKPSESESVKPSETETAKPTESETVKPSETETQKPTQESTEQPTQAPTTEQPTQGTTTPITTEPTAPATTTEGTTLAPSTTRTQPTTGGIIGDLATTFPKTTTPADSSTTAQAENPDTGDSMSVKTLAIAIIALLSVIAIVIILMYKYKKQTTKIISLVMCVAISASAITGVTFFTAKGVDDNRESFTVEKVITVDGEETNVGATVSYQESKEDNSKISEPIKLTCNPKELGTSSNSQKVYFYAETDMKVDGVSLYNADTDEELIKLVDDGLSEGDVKADDGIYSGKVMIPPCKEAKTFKYYALIKTEGQEIKSRVRELQIIAPFTEQEIKQMDELFRRLEALGNESFYKMSESKRKKVAEKEFESLLADGLIDNYYFYKNDTLIGFTYLNGLPSAFTLEKKDPMLAGRSVESKPSSSSLNSMSSLNKIVKTNNKVIGVTGKALITYGWDNPIEDNSNWNVYQNTANRWEKIGFKTTLHPLPTVLDFRTIFTEQDYQYIVLAEHGTEYPDYNELGGIGPHYAISTGEATSIDRTSNEYLNDVRSGRVIQAYGQYCLTPSFFVFYYENKLDNAIIDIESCMSFGNGPFDDDSFATAFIDNCGAEAVISYHNSVFIVYAASITRQMILSLMNHENNIKLAYEEAKEICGQNDTEYMYNCFSETDEWLSIQENGKTLKQTIEEKQANGESAHPILNIKGKIRGRFIDGETKEPVQTEVLIHKDNRYGELYDDYTYVTPEGNLYLELPSGKYVLEVQAKDYVTRYIDIDSQLNSNISLGDLEIYKTSFIPTPDPTPGIDDNFAGGDGSKENPYQIATAKQLDAVRYNLKSNFVLVNDIDLSEYENWVPIGGIKKDEPSFSGNFDGCGHKISNMSMCYKIENNKDVKESYYFGLFREANNISNLYINNVDINIELTGNLHIGVGSVVWNLGKGGINNCVASGTIKIVCTDSKPELDIGGIACYQNSAQGAQSCINNVDINISGGSSVSVGGVFMSPSNITDCINNGEIIIGSLNDGTKPSVSCGGITSYAQSANRCHNYGNISIYSSAQITTGGISARNIGIDYKINQCSNYGNIRINATKLADDNSWTIVRAGGIIGENHQEISKCINYGIIDFFVKNDNYSGTVVNIGGIAGDSITTVYDANIAESVNCGDISGNIKCLTRWQFNSTVSGIGWSREIQNCYNISNNIYLQIECSEITQSDFSLYRIGDDRTAEISNYKNNYSINTTTLNGSIPTKDIGPDQKNGGSMTKAEIEKAIQELGFELPGELPNAS